MTESSAPDAADTPSAVPPGHRRSPWFRRLRPRTWIAGGTIAAVVVAFALYWFQPWRLLTSTEVHEALPVLTVASAPVVPQPVVPSDPAPAAAEVAAVAPPHAPATRSDRPPARSALPPADTPGGSPTARTFSALPSAAAAPSSAAPAPAPPITTSAPTLPKPAPSLRPAPSPRPAPAQAVALAAGSLISHEHETSGTVRLVRLADGRRVLTLEKLNTSDGPALHVWLTDAPVRAGSDGWSVFDDGRYVDLGALKGNRGDQVYEIPAGTDLTGLGSVSIWCERFAVSFGAAALTPA